jgi:uncharacterized integral membrane protein
MTRRRPKRGSAVNQILGRLQKQQKPVKPLLFWASSGLTLVCSVVLVWLFLRNVSDAEFGIWPRILIAVLLVIFIAASLATTEIIPWTSRSWADWRRPKVLGMVIYMVLGGVAFAAGLANIFNPPAAEQKTLLETKRDVGAVKKDTGQLVEGQRDIAEAVGVGAPSLIRQKIAGVWGRPGCAVTYRFTLTDRALKVRSVKSAAGMEPYNPEYSVIGERNNTAPNGERSSIMETTETVGFWPGFGVQFQYYTDGSNERLVWDHKKMATMPLELGRC